MAEVDGCGCPSTRNRLGRLDTWGFAWHRERFFPRFTFLNDEHQTIDSFAWFSAENEKDPTMGTQC